MPVTTDQPAPYAPASAVLDLIDRHRNRGLPPVVDADVLLRAGVSDSLVPRTLQALRALDLLGDDGKPTPVFEGLRLAPSGEYKQRMAEWLTAAYADALSFVDPATDDEVAIRDAFRKYIPTGQQNRMVTLFIGLFTAAGVMPPRAKTVGSPAKPASNKVTVTVKRRTLGQPAKLAERPRVVADAGGQSQVPPAIAGLLATLPPEDGMWTQERRDKFLSTFGAVLDYSFKIREPARDESDETATDP